MKCPNCWANISHSDRICPMCGGGCLPKELAHAKKARTDAGNALEKAGNVSYTLSLACATAIGITGFMLWRLDTTHSDSLIFYFCLAGAGFGIAIGYCVKSAFYGAAEMLRCLGRIEDNGIRVMPSASDSPSDQR